MFKVSDSMENRHRRLRRFVRMEPGVTVVVAAAEFEWAVSRAIIALGILPNVEIRVMVEACSGLGRYRDLWKKVVKPHTGRSLPSIIPDWQELREHAFKLRNELVHGVRGTVSVDFAANRLDCLLESTNSIFKFAEEQGVDLGRKLPVRRRKKPSTNGGAQR